VAKIFLFLFILCLTCGCSSSKKIIIADTLDATPVITGSVVDATALNKGGTLVFGAFKPGPGAEADDDTDQLSLMMIKGIKDTLPSQNTHFTIQTGDDDDSDFLLDGFIEDYGHQGHLMHKHQVHLSLDGQIWLRETGEKLLLFQTSLMIDPKIQEPRVVAYQIGAAIARFIGSHIQGL